MCDSKCTNCVKYSSPDNTIIEYMCKDNNFLLVFLEMLVAMIFLLTLIFVYLIVYERYKHDDMADPIIFIHAYIAFLSAHRWWVAMLFQ